LGKGVRAATPRADSPVSGVEGEIERFPGLEIGCVSGRREVGGVIGKAGKMKRSGRLPAESGQILSTKFQPLDIAAKAVFLRHDVGEGLTGDLDLVHRVESRGKAIGVVFAGTAAEPAHGFVGRELENEPDAGGIDEVPVEVKGGLNL